MLLKSCLFVSLLSLGPVAAQETPPADDARAAFDRLVAADHWREVNAAKATLAAFGEDALPWIRRGAEHHQDAGVRRACYELLVESFATDEHALRTIANDGLTDGDATIRYICAFHLGEHKVHEAFRRLEKVLNDPGTDTRTRLAAAKSLGELGEADGLPLIYDALGSDHYMERYLANLGLKGLTGRDLDDFDYDFSEGAFVSGGVELKRARRPIADAEQRAARHRAIAAYCRWLKVARPELFKHLAG